MGGERIEQASNLTTHSRLTTSKRGGEVILDHRKGVGGIEAVVQTSEGSGSGEDIRTVLGDRRTLGDDLKITTADQN